MNTHADKTPEEKSRSLANAVSKEQGSSESATEFVDNRSAIIAQRKLQVMANNSPQVKKAVQFQAMADNHTSQQEPVQMAGGAHAYDAGEGALWHVHHGDHVKYGGLVQTRINFAGRTRNQILRQLRRQRNVPPQSQQGGITYHQCVRWILTHL